MTISSKYNTNLLKTLISTKEFQERFDTTKNILKRHFDTVDFDFAPEIYSTQTDRDNIELVIEIQTSEAGKFLLKIFFKGDGWYAPGGSGDHFPSSKLKFELAYIDHTHDTLWGRYESGSWQAEWSGGGEYYNGDGDLIDSPPFYQKLETIIPEICKTFENCILHPELAMTKKQETKKDKEERWLHLG